MIGRRGGRTRPTRAGAAIAICVALLIGIGMWEFSTRAANLDADPQVTPVDVFTLVATGVVFVDPDTSEIIWKNVDGYSKTIGRHPWRNPVKPRPSESTGSPAWREDRDIVGNPGHDLVSWVESSNGTRGDLVVVKASTGDVLARAVISAPDDRSVVIASVDDETVYFATPDPTTGLPDMPGTDIWTWRWATGEVPVALGSGSFFNDVSAGTWAVYGESVVEFRNVDAQTLTTIPDTGDWLTDFGGALSPDGKYWYSEKGTHIVNIATGEAVTLSSVDNRGYGWTEAAELTLTDPFMVCSAPTGQCRGPANVLPYDVCAPYDLVCGDHLPVN